MAAVTLGKAFDPGRIDRIAAPRGFRRSWMPGPRKTLFTCTRRQFRDNRHIYRMCQMTNTDFSLVRRDRTGQLGIPEILVTGEPRELARRNERERTDHQTWPAIGGPPPGVIALILDIRTKDLKPDGIIDLIEHRTDHSIPEMGCLFPVAGQRIECHVMLPHEVWPLYFWQTRFRCIHVSNQLRVPALDECLFFWS